MRTIQLKCSDDEIFEVGETIANQSEVIRKILEDSDKPSDTTIPIPIPIPNVNGRVLSKVIEWITKHVDKQLREEERRNWEKEFVDVKLEVIYELVLAADYLEVSSLFHLGCKKVAGLIACKSPEEIRKIFNIENDFSPEEEAELRRKNAWAFESATGTSTSTSTGTGTITK